MAEIQNELVILTSKTLDGLKQTEAQLTKVDTAVKQVGTASTQAFSGKDITDYKTKLNQLQQELKGQEQIIKDTKTAINDLGNTKSKVYQQYKQDLTSAKTLQNQIKQEIKDTTTAMKEHQTIAEKSQAIFTKLGGIIAGAFALNQIKDFTVESVKLYLEADKGEKMLAASLGTRKGLTKDLILFAKQLQENSVIPKDTIIAQAQYLAALGLSEKMIKKVIQAAADWSAKDPFTTFDSAVRQLGATLEKGSWEKGLAKLIGNMKDSGLDKEAIKNGAAIDLIVQKFQNGAKELSETDFGFVEKQKNQLREMREELGKLIFTPVKGAWQSFIDDFISQIPAIKGAIKSAQLNLTFDSVMAQAGILAANNYYNTLIQDTKLSYGQIQNIVKETIKNYEGLDDEYSQAYSGQLQERLKMFNDSVAKGITKKQEEIDKQKKLDEKALKDKEAFELEQNKRLADENLQIMNDSTEQILRGWEEAKKNQKNIDSEIVKDKKEQYKELEEIDKNLTEIAEKAAKERKKIAEQEARDKKETMQIGFNTANDLTGLYYEHSRILDENAKKEEIRLAGDNQTKINEINNRYAEKEKQRAANEARVQSYLAAVSALAQTSGGISVRILAALAALALGEIYAENIEAQNVKAYYKGTPYVEGESGVDKVPAKLTVGERVVTADVNAKETPLLNAIQEGRKEEYIRTHYVLPELNKLLIGEAMKRIEAKEESKMSNILGATNFTANLSDYEIRRKINETNRLLNLIAIELKNKKEIKR